jgi:hypothetical protein
MSGVFVGYLFRAYPDIMLAIRTAFSVVHALPPFAATSSLRLLAHGGRMRRLFMLRMRTALRHAPPATPVLAFAAAVRVLRTMVLLRLEGPLFWVWCAMEEEERRGEEEGGGLSTA